MWTNLLIIALVIAGLQWILVIINKLLTQYFNMPVFILAMTWSIWAMYCLYKMHN